MREEKEIEREEAKLKYMIDMQGKKRDRVNNMKERIKEKDRKG